MRGRLPRTMKTQAEIRLARSQRTLLCYIDSLWKWRSLARVIMLDPPRLQSRGDFMLRRVVFVAALVVLFLLPAHDRIVNAAADNPLEGVWQVMDVGGQPAAGVYIFTGKHSASGSRLRIDRRSMTQAKPRPTNFARCGDRWRRTRAHTTSQAISSRSGRSSRKYRWS